RRLRRFLLGLLFLLGLVLGGGLGGRLGGLGGSFFLGDGLFLLGLVLFLVLEIAPALVVVLGVRRAELLHRAAGPGEGLLEQLGRLLHDGALLGRRLVLRRAARRKEPLFGARLLRRLFLGLLLGLLELVVADGAEPE